MESLKRDLTSCKISASTVLLDIEGTTTSISFVKDILFPYIRSNLEKFLDENWGSDKLQEHVKALRIQVQQDEENKVEGVIPIPEEGKDDTLKLALINNINWQMDNDRKTKSLKDLQGVIMEEGYKTGDLKGHVYDDVERSLKTWSEQNKSIYIYSSGSVAAQKLLFGHSEKGDMLPLIKGHFDTNVGMKGDASSYKEILKQISISPSEAVFFTDVPKEARAAKEAGILAILVSREGNAPLADQDKTEFQVITSFEDVEFETNCKKMKISPENLVTIDNKEIENCSFSIEDRQKPDPIIQNCIESEKHSNNDNICDGSSNQIELMEVDDSNAEKNSDTINSVDTKKEDSSTESEKIEPTETMKEETAENKEEKSDVNKEESIEIIKEESTDSVKEELIPSVKEETLEKKGDSAKSMKEELALKEESIQSVKEETLEKKEDSAKSMKEELAEEKKEMLNEGINQNTMEDIQKESNEIKKDESIQNEMEVANEDKKEKSADSLKEKSAEIKKEASAEIIEVELDEGKKEGTNENMKQNPTENMQEETNGTKEESTDTVKEISGDIRKEESIQSVKETPMQSETNEVNSDESAEKEDLADGKNKVPNENMEQNSTENIQEESNERGKEELTESMKKESIENVPTESIKEESTERNGEEPVITNGEIKTSNVDDVTCINENDENVASVGTEKKDNETNNLNENKSVTIHENNRVEKGEDLKPVNVKNLDQNLTDNDDKNISSTNSKPDLSSSEVKKTVMEESEKEVTNGLEETNKKVSEVCNGVENSSETKSENVKSLSQNGQIIKGESKSANGLSTTDSIKSNGCTEEVPLESKKCDNTESTALESVVEAL